MECGALTECALEPDAPALHFDQALGDVQAKAGAGGFARLLVFGAEELLEDLSLILGTDADAVILDPDVQDIGWRPRDPSDWRRPPRQLPARRLRVCTCWHC